MSLSIRTVLKDTIFAKLRCIIAELQGLKVEQFPICCNFSRDLPPTKMATETVKVSIQANNNSDDRLRHRNAVINQFSTVGVCNTVQVAHKQLVQGKICKKDHENTGLDSIGGRGREGEGGGFGGLRACFLSR